MSKKVKIILIGLGIIIFLCLLMVGGFMMKFNSETSKMTPVGTGKIAENIFAVKDDFVNMYLVQDSDKYIAIDAGKDLKVIESELKKLDIDPGKVVALFLTHTDMDHVAGIPLFKQAKLFFSKNEVKMLNGEKQKIPFYNNKISRNDYVLLDDYQSLTIGSVKIVGLLTEGHTTGSMCYQINDKYLFTGDILSLKKGKIGPSVSFFDLDHKMATKAILKITSIPNVEYILTSHFGVSKDYKNAVRDWKE